ncbi:MAG TPA: DUF4062 domain-containing protein [Ktedonobacteraceae bacterium]
MGQPLTLFISSKMQELAVERQAVQTALKSFQMSGWLWETDAGARPEPVRSVYLQEVEASDIYLGLFWLGYGPYTIEEFQYARTLQKPCLVYEKYLNLDQRDPRLTAFLQNLQQVTSPAGLAVCRFTTTAQLADQVQHDVIQLLTTIFHKTRIQPAGKGASPSRLRPRTVSARNQSIAIGGNNYGTVEQNNYGDTLAHNEES